MAPAGAGGLHAHGLGEKNVAPAQRRRRVCRVRFMWSMPSRKINSRPGGMAGMTGGAGGAGRRTGSVASGWRDLKALRQSSGCTTVRRQRREHCANLQSAGRPPHGTRQVAPPSPPGGAQAAGCRRRGCCRAAGGCRVPAGPRWPSTPDNKSSGTREIIGGGGGGGGIRPRCCRPAPCARRAAGASLRPTARAPSQLTINSSTYYR